MGFFDTLNNLPVGKSTLGNVASGSATSGSIGPGTPGYRVLEGTGAVDEAKKKQAEKDLDASIAEAYGVASVYQGSNEKIKNSERNKKAQALFETVKNKKYGLSSITLDKDTGAIVLTAPEGLLKDKDFQKYFPASTFKELSQAYQTNKDYKVTYTEYNSETGQTEEKQITVPEYIKKMNDNLQAYTKNAYYAQLNRNSLKEEFGDKADSLSDIQMSVIYDTSSNVVQIPEFLRNAKYFDIIRNDIDADGNVSKDIFKKAFNLDNMSAEDISALMAQIDGELQGSSWTEDRYYEDEDGYRTYNKGNIDEAAKALALRNFIMANEPDGHWYQQTGLAIRTAAVNFGYTFQDMVLKMTWVDTIGDVIDFGSEKLTGQGTGWGEWKKENEKAVDYFNAQQAILQDDTQMIATLANIAGFAAGIGAGAFLSGGAGNAVKSFAEVRTGIKAGKALRAAAAGERVLTASKAARAVQGVKAVLSASEMAKAAKGAKILVKAMSAAERVKFQAQVAKVFLTETHAFLGGSAKFIHGFLMDTLHDAIMFDTRNMLEALDSNDNETRQYWLNQMAENAAFYGPLEGGKNIVKHFSTPGASKTGVGKAINAIVTKGANRFAADGMQTRKKVLDWIYEAEGGHKNYLDKKYKSLLNRDHPKNRKAARLAKKITALDQADEIMHARKALGDVNIEWDGFLKVSDSTEKELMEANLGVKAAEIAADTYNRQIDWKRQEMVGFTKDPATGKRAYINESLAKSAETSARQYVELAKAVNKANLGELAKKSGLTQDVIDFMMGSANHKRMSAIAKAGGEHAKEAQKAADIISTDLKSLTEKLPQDVREKALAYIESSPFFYMELNQYGIAHNYLSKEDISGYVNKTWEEAGGYQPIITEEAEENFFIQSKDARYRTTITQEMESLSYQVKAGQHYMDPEIVRQTRLNVAAKSAINRELLDNYNSRVGVSFEDVVSGEQTKFARDVERGRKDIDASVALCTSSMFTKDENFFSDFTFNKKNVTASLGKTRKLNGSQIETVVGSMSDDDINRALIDRDRLTKGAGPDAWTREIEDEESFKAFYDSLNKTGKAYVDEKCAEFAKGAGDVATYNNYLQVVSAYGDDFEKGVRRAELVGDDSFRNSTTAKMAYKDIKEGRTAFQNGYAVQKARANLRGINGVNADELAENLVGGYNSAIEEYLKNVKSNKAFQKAVSAYWSNYAEGAVPEAIIDFFALQQLKKGKNIKGFKANLNKRLDDFIEKNKKALFQGDYKGNADDQIKKYADEIFNDILDDEMNAARQSIEAFGKAPIDAEEVWKRAKSINDEIKGLENQIDMGASDLDIIAYMDSQGRVAYAKVDSSFASLYNRRTHVPRAEKNGLDYVNAISATAFRMGTTALNIASWGNQLLRDYGSALIMGGSWSTIKKAADGMTKVFGESVVEQLKNFDPEGYELKQVEAVLKRIDPEGKLHMDMNAAAISRELMIGAAKSPSSTETGLYRKLWDELRSEENAQLDKLDETLKDKIKKLNPDNLVNAKREEYLRNRVYANNLQQALTEGYTLKQARIYAEFAMNNATINFGRQLYHLQSIAESTPYFRAAINGTTSFWRMWSLDPVGVSGRIFGGLIMPTIALISHSMADEDNRKVYESIPEWQKRESFVFVMNGEAISLPFPQEMAAVVAPFRQFVEHLYGVDKASFAELAFNDFLGFAPVDLTGFSTVDFNRLQGDPTLADILGLLKCYTVPFRVHSSHLLPFAGLLSCGVPVPSSLAPHCIRSNVHSLALRLSTLLFVGIAPVSLRSARCLDILNL